MLGRIAYYVSTISLLAGSLASAATVTVRSGNGSIGGRDGSVTFLLGPSVGDFSRSFTSTDFSNAQSGPPAFIVSRNPLWISRLPSDPLAQWIGTNPNAASSGNTALYAISFQIGSAFSSATLTLHYAADDTPSFLGGLFLNGTAVCTSLIEVGFSQEHTLTCNNVGPLLRVGTNWLYFDVVNVGGSAGLVFSATITTTETGPFLGPVINGVVNGASFTQGSIAPGTIISIFGTGLAAGTTVASLLPLPTSLLGTTADVAGLALPLLYVSPGQINAQLPYGLPNAPARLTVKGATGAVGSISITVAQASPAIFTATSEGSGPAAALHTNYKPVRKGVQEYAKSGETIILFCTGLGAVNGSTDAGTAAPSSPLATTAVIPAVTMGGREAQVLFSGLAPGFAGLYQINLIVPSDVAGDVPTVVQVGNARSKEATITVSGPIFMAKDYVGVLQERSGTVYILDVKFSVPPSQGGRGAYSLSPSPTGSPVIDSGPMTLDPPVDLFYFSGYSATLNLPFIGIADTLDGGRTFIGLLYRVGRLADIKNPDAWDAIFSIKGY